MNKYPYSKIKKNIKCDSVKRKEKRIKCLCEDHYKKLGNIHARYYKIKLNNNQDYIYCNVTKCKKNKYLYLRYEDNFDLEFWKTLGINNF